MPGGGGGAPRARASGRPAAGRGRPPRPRWVPSTAKGCGAAALAGAGGRPLRLVLRARDLGHGEPAVRNPGASRQGSRCRTRAPRRCRTRALRRDGLHRGTGSRSLQRPGKDPAHPAGDALRPAPTQPPGGPGACRRPRRWPGPRGAVAATSSSCPACRRRRGPRPARRRAARAVPPGRRGSRGSSPRRRRSRPGRPPTAPP